ncbi:hypothetical protein Tco_1191903 [Tanacetum coccineum]
MENENPIRTLGDYSRPSYKGYGNTIEILDGNKVVPLRSDTIRLVQNGCAFHRLRFEDPIQHLEDFLRIVDSIDLNSDIRNTTRLRLFHFSLHDQAIHWLDRLPVGSISTWDDLTTRESLSEAWTRFKDLLQKVPHHACEKLRKIRPKVSWETIEYLAQYEEEKWNDPIFFEKGSPDYINATLEQKLECQECQVESLMKSEVLLDYEVIFDEKKLWSS